MSLRWIVATGMVAFGLVGFAGAAKLAAVEVRSGSAETMQQEVAAALRAGQVVTAQALLNELPEHHPVVRFQQAWAYQLMGDAEKAWDNLQRAPDSTAARTRDGLALDALANIVPLVRRLPVQERAGALYVCAIIATSLSKHDAAEEAMMLALRNDRGGEGLFPFARAQCLMDLALLHYQQGHPTAAETFASALWELTPSVPQRPLAGLLLARIVQDGQPQRAQRILASVRATSDDPQQRLEAGYALLALLDDQPSAQIALAEELLMLNPEHQATLTLWVEAVIAQHGSAARDLIAHRQQHYPEQSPWYHWLAAQQQRLWTTGELLRRAEVLREQGDFAAARRVLATRQGEREVQVFLAGLPDATREALAAWWEVPAVQLAFITRRVQESGGIPPPLRPAVAALIQQTTDLAVAQQAAALALRRSVHHHDHERQLQDLAEQVLIADHPHSPHHGEAWALRAQRLHQQWVLQQTDNQVGSQDGLSQDDFSQEQITPEQIQAAWIAAARNLAPDHPWAAIAGLQYAKAVMQAVPAGTVLTDLKPGMRDDMLRAAEKLAPIAWAKDSESALKLRYELAKLYAQCGQLELAKALISGLVPHADNRRKQLLNSFLRKIAACTIETGE